MQSKYWLATLTFVGLAVYLAERANLALHPFIRYYLNDLIIVPLTALLVRTLMRIIFRTPTFILSFAEIAFIVLFYSILFELILPFYLQRYTADYVDVMMYALGGVFYGCYMNKS